MNTSVIAFHGLLAPRVDAFNSNCAAGSTQELYCGEKHQGFRTVV